MKAKPRWLFDLVMGLGFAIFCGGLWLIYPALALLAIGAVVCLIGFAGAWGQWFEKNAREKRRQQEE